MRYIKVRWIHEVEDDPVWLFSELDDERWETRKIEVFRDGRRGRADARHPEDPATGTGLSETPIADTDDVVEFINDQGEFEAVEITREEFDAEWNRR